MTNAQVSAPNINEIIGELVHTQMWRKKVTQTALAGVIGVTQSAVARKLRGERPFAIDELFAAADFLDVSVTALLPNAERPHQGGPDGGDECPQPGSNRRPADYKSVVLTFPTPANRPERIAA